MTGIDNILQEVIIATEIGEGKWFVFITFSKDINFEIYNYSSYKFITIVVLKDC